MCQIQYLLFSNCKFVVDNKNCSLTILGKDLNSFKVRATVLGNKHLSIVCWALQCHHFKPATSSDSVTCRDPSEVQIMERLCNVFTEKPKHSVYLEGKEKNGGYKHYP